MMKKTLIIIIALFCCIQLIIPSEGYSFSNNVKSVFGPPSFEKAAFILDKDTIEMKIELNY